MKYLIPHTAEWLSTLDATNPHQAEMTRQIIKLAGKAEVCSVCGDAPATDYKVIGAMFTPDIGASIRLCDDCREIRRDTNTESFRAF